MHDLKIPEKLADLPREPGRLFSLEEIVETRAHFDGYRSSGPGCLIYSIADVLSVLWPLSWGQQFRKWTVGSMWLCHTHLFNWSDLICNRDCKLSESPEWQGLLSSMGSSPGPWAAGIILCKSLFCFPGLSPHHFPLVPSRWLVFLLQQLKFNYALFHDLMVFHLFNIHKFWLRLWFQSSCCIRTA